MNSGHRLTIARLLIGLVLLLNIQCGFLFITAPKDYAGNFELSGVPGQAMVQGMGVLFIMWNVPYAVALFQPVKHRVSHQQAIWMQAIGLAGESWLLISLAPGHEVLRATALKFILFDGLGLLALTFSLWLLRNELRGQSEG